MAVFITDNGKEKVIHFGGAGYLDYTQYGTGREKHKERYIRRHRAREDWENPFSAGALSKWILWNKPTLVASIHDYKKHFNL